MLILKRKSARIDVAGAIRIAEMRSDFFIRWIRRIAHQHCFKK